MPVFCVNSVLEHQQQQLNLPEARIWAAPVHGKRYGPPGKAAWIVHHNTNLTKARSLSSSQPGGPPCWVISLAFGLIGAYWPCPRLESASVSHLHAFFVFQFVYFQYVLFSYRYRLNKYIKWKMTNNILQILSAIWTGGGSKLNRCKEENFCVGNSN